MYHQVWNISICMSKNCSIHRTLIDKVRAAQYIRQHPGEVCPAKWKEGAETLTPSLDLVGKI